MITGILRRSAAALLLAVAIGGCTASEYAKPIGDFSKATAEAQTALADYNKAVMGAREDFTRNRALKAASKVAPLPDDCLETSKRCRVALQTPKDRTPLLLTPDTPTPRLLTLMAAFAEYAAHLNAIATADEAGAVEANVIATGESLEKIIALVPGAGASGLSGYAQPVAALIGWGLGLYVDSVKLDALKTAVRKAEPIIVKSEAAFVGTAKLATVAVSTHMSEIVSMRADAFNAKPTRENLDKYAAAAAAYDAFLQGTSPETVFKDFVQSHAKLNKALNSREVSFSDAIKQIQAFHTRAKKLAKILKDIHEVSKA